MESRKRKEVPGSAGEDGSEIADRPSKSREPNAKEDETDKTQLSSIDSQADPTEASIEVSVETDGDEETDAATAAITNTIDAAALPSGTPAPVSIPTEPAIDAATGNPPTAPVDIPPTEGKSELDDAGGLAAVGPKVLPKPSSPEELAHWNQMFFDLMVRVSTMSTALFCSPVLLR
jgi:hypothetical protein